jgi:hypothetical protein
MLHMPYEAGADYTGQQIKDIPLESLKRAAIDAEHRKMYRHESVLIQNYLSQYGDSHETARLAAMPAEEIAAQAVPEPGELEKQTKELRRAEGLTAAHQGPRKGIRESIGQHLAGIPKLKLAAGGLMALAVLGFSLRQHTNTEPLRPENRPGAQPDTGLYQPNTNRKSYVEQPGERSGARINVRGRTARNVDHKQLAHAAGSTMQDVNVNVNLRDDTTPLTNDWVQGMVSEAINQGHATRS